MPDALQAMPAQAIRIILADIIPFGIGKAQAIALAL